MLSELVKSRNIVLATGGGAVLSGENREMLRRNGTVVYLRATIDDLWRRTRQDKNRPLLRKPPIRGRSWLNFTRNAIRFTAKPHI